MELSSRNLSCLRTPMRTTEAGKEVKRLQEEQSKQIAAREEEHGKEGPCTCILDAWALKRLLWICFAPLECTRTLLVLGGF